MNYDFNQFLEPELSSKSNKNVGTSNKHNIDKTAIFYHVTTSSKLKDRIFFLDVAKYRRNLLFKLCKERNIKIVFSVTMPNHTHEVFITRNWKSLSEVIRILNMNTSKYLSKHYESSTDKGAFSRDVAYTPIRSIQQLFYVGKYIQSNPDYLIKEGKTVPDSCIWMMEKDYYPEPFDSSIYTKLFNMKGSELLKLYESLSRQEAIEYSHNHFTDWTDDMQRSMFYKN